MFEDLYQLIPVTFRSTNLRQVTDGVVAAAILLFVVLEYGLKTTLIPDSVMALSDAGLRVLIFATIAWHILRERVNGHA